MVRISFHPILDRVRLVSVTLTLQFILAATVYSQLQRATLGMVSELRAVKSPHGLFTGDFNGDGLADLGSYNEKQVLLQIQENDSALWHPSMVELGETMNITKIIAANCTGDKMSDLIVVDGKSASIRIYRALHGLVFYLRSSLQFKDEVPEVLAVDMNNDGKTDIVIFGKRENGITVYTGNGTGGFTKTQTLFPQRSFSYLLVTDLNDDKINDIAGIDWLGNEVVISNGYGKMKFSDPVVMQYEWEPNSLAAARIDSDGLKDLALSFVNQKELIVLKGNGTGQYNRSQMIPLRYIPDQLMCADLNADGKADLIQYSHDMRGFSVWLNEEDGMYRDATEFSGGRQPRGFVLFSHLDTDITDVALADNSTSSIRVIYNSRVSPPHGQDFMYALGLSPTSVLSFDIVGNNLIDIVALNKESQTISLFVNQGNGVLSGQLSFPIPVKGTTMQYAVKNGSGSYFIVGSPDNGEISITDFSPKSFEYKSYNLPAQKNSELLARYIEKSAKYLNFFLLSREADGRQAAIIKYSQISPTRFVQQTVISRFEPAFIAGTMGDFTKNGDLDIAFLGSNSGHGALDLRTIIRNETTKTLQPRLDYSIDVKDIPPTLLWNADLTNDGYPDMIINLRGSMNELLISLNGSQQKFQLPKFKSRIPVNVASRNQLKVLDVNGDHKMDIVLNNSLTKEIQVFWGTGNGTFPSVSRLISSAGIGGFTFADLYHDSQQHLIVTDSLNGWLKIIPLK